MLQMGQNSNGQCMNKTKMKSLLLKAYIFDSVWFNDGRTQSVIRRLKYSALILSLGIKQK